MANPPVAEGVSNATRSLSAPGAIEVIVGAVGAPAISTDELSDHSPTVGVASISPVREAT